MPFPLKSSAIFREMALFCTNFSSCDANSRVITMTIRFINSRLKDFIGKIMSHQQGLDPGICIKLMYVTLNS